MRVTSSSARSASPAVVGGRRAWPAVLALAARDRVNLMVFVSVLVVVGFGDSILLPFDFTQRLSFANWQYFDARYVAFTVAFAIAMAWVITLQVHAMRILSANTRRSSVPRRGGPLGAFAAVLSLLPSFLCCSPIVPTLVGLLGLSATTQLRTTGRIQYFFATNQDLLLLASLALVIGSGMWSMRKLVRASCLTDECGLVEEEAGRVLEGESPQSVGLGTPADPEVLVAASVARRELRE